MRCDPASVALQRALRGWALRALLVLAVLLGAACQAPHDEATSDEAGAPDTSASRDPGADVGEVDAGRADVASALPASPSTSANDTVDERVGLDEGDLDPRFDGFGPLRLGMATREAVDAWPGLYADRPQRIAARSCDYAQVPGDGLPYFALMFDGGRFVRYGGTNDDVVAPGGGRRGMAVDALKALYRDRLSKVPDPERPRGDGYRLVRDTPGAVPMRLAFVIERGQVVEWYVGTLQAGKDHTVGCPH